MNPPAALIHTLTGNLLAEHTIDAPDWTPGQTVRGRASSFQAGGKGINVVRMLARLESPAVALAFAGGPAGQACRDWMSSRGLGHRFFETRAATRLGMVVRSASQPETTFFTPDVIPDAGAMRECAAFLASLPAGTPLAVCGSLPGWDRPEYAALRDVLLRWPARGPLIVDTYGPALADFAGVPTTLIKVNRTELAGLLKGSSAASEGAESAIGPAALETLARDRPVENWIVSAGRDAVLVRPEKNQVTVLSPPKVKEVSATGSGDVLLACVLHRWLLAKRPLIDAVAAALPYAAANAAHPGVAEFPLPSSAER